MTTNEELLEGEARGWEELQRRFDVVEARAAWTTPGVNGDWSAKDELAHVAAWHEWATGILEQRRNGVKTDPPTDEWVDARNAEFFERYRDTSLDDVRAFADRAREAFRAEIATCDPERSWRLVRGNAEAHYDEHIEHLDKFLGDK